MISSRLVDSLIQVTASSQSPECTATGKADRQVTLERVLQNCLSKATQK